MNHTFPTRLALIAIVVAVAGWGFGYVAFKGIDRVFVALGGKSISDNSSQAGTVANIDPTTPTSSPHLPTPSSNSPALTDSQDELVILMGGDVMFDRHIRALGDKNGYDSLFDAPLKDLFKSADISVANLEGPITSNQSKTLVDSKTTNSFMFTFPVVSAQTLKDAGISVVSLANNHEDNFGLSGYDETQKHLQEAGIDWFGNPWNGTSTRLTHRDMNGIEPTDSPIVTIIRKNGFTIAFVGYHAFQKGVDRVISEIKRVSGPDVFTIVMPHWGEEYMFAPSNKMKSYARAFIDAGADAVIGAHPHIIMDQEWVGNVPVYYSLGNLLFDQYFSPEVMRGKIVELHIRKDDRGIRLDNVQEHHIKLLEKSGTKLDIEI